MRKIFLLALLLLWTTTANAAVLIKTVAMVNNDAVTSYQLEKRLTAALAAGDQRQLSQEEHDALRLNVLNTLIEEILVEQRIQEIGLTVADHELDSAIEDVQRQNKLTSEQLEKALLAQGMSFPDYRLNLRKEILRYKLIAREVRSKVEVTRAEIREYFDAHAEEYMVQPTLHLCRISYPLPEDADEKIKEQLIQRAQATRQQLLAGKPFTEVLDSLDGDAEGGDMGTMTEKELNPKLHLVIEGLKAGQVSEPVEAFGSVHICQVVERTPAKAELSEEVNAQIEKILAAQNSEKRFTEWKKGLRKDAIIDIRI